MQTETRLAQEVHLPDEPNHVSRIPELDGLRGIAALAVFCHHVLYMATPAPELWKQPVRLIAALAQAGSYGVDLFFVLSGFLITSIILTDRSRPHYYWNFYWRRALRIFPLYFAILLWLALIFHPARRYVLLSAFFLANFERLFHLHAYGPFWTLAIEEQFYLFWPRAAKYLSVKRVERLSLAIAATCLLLRLLDTAIGHHNYRFTFFHCDGLAIGAVLACQINLLRSKPPGQRESTSRETRLLLSTAAIGLLLTALPAAFSIDTHVGLAVEAFRLTGVNLLAYTAVRTSVLFSGAGFLLFLRSRLLTFFGLISYALYMLHEYVMIIYPRVAGRLHVGDMRGFFVRFAIILGVTVGVSIIARYAIEWPAMSLRRYVLQKS